MGPAAGPAPAAPAVVAPATPDEARRCREATRWMWDLSLLWAVALGFSAAAAAYASLIFTLWAVEGLGGDVDGDVVAIAVGVPVVLALGIAMVGAAIGLLDARHLAGVDRLARTTPFVPGALGSLTGGLVVAASVVLTTVLA